MLMRTFALLPALLLPAALIAQAPAPSLGDRVKAERPAVDKLMADLQFPEALKRAESLLPATKPVFDKTDNQALVQSAVIYMDLGQAYRMAVETADAAGSWEKALEYAKTAKALSAESYAAIKDPFTQTVTYYTQAGARAKQVLEENDAHIKELKGKSVLDAGERQELDLAIGVEKELVDDAKWVKFFQTYLDVVKRESEAYDPLVKVMEDKLKGEADQVADYKAGKGEKTKWVEAVVSSPAYLEAQGDKAGKARFLYRLSVLDPENKKVQHQLDVLFGRASAAPAKPAKKGKKG
ncbi:hypothetical protein GETHED_21950 [Geothrix edaphica]|uniref:Tetratricopeptide repeat protein n=2 Tax=Geothrix edaphica TaxID=2927976 RepID=A0ABQ5PZL8_9BACT|nr:hypothetical protein GETHED_21950 [Geothrix edaphica]